MKILFNTFENRQTKSLSYRSLNISKNVNYDKTKSLWMRIYNFFNKETNLIPEIVNKYLFAKAFLIVRDLKKISKLKDISFHDVYLNVSNF